MKIKNIIVLLLFSFCNQLYSNYDPKFETSYRLETGSNLSKDLQILTLDLDQVNFNNLIEQQVKISTAYEKTMLELLSFDTKPRKPIDTIEKRIHKVQKAYDNLMRWIDSTSILPATEQDTFNQPTKKTRIPVKTLPTIVPCTKVSSDTITITNFAKHGFDNDGYAIQAIQAIQINTMGKVWVLDHKDTKREIPSYDLTNFPSEFESYKTLTLWGVNSYFLVTKILDSDSITIRANTKGLGGGKKKHRSKKKKEQSEYILASHSTEITTEFDRAQNMYNRPLTDERVKKAIRKFLLICKARLEYLDNLQKFIEGLSKEEFISFLSEVMFINKNIMLSGTQQKKLMSSICSQKDYINGIFGDKGIYSDLLALIPNSFLEGEEIQISQYAIDKVIESLNNDVAHEEFEANQHPRWLPSLDTDPTTPSQDSFSSAASANQLHQENQLAETEQELPVLRKLDKIIKPHASPARSAFDQIVSFNFFNKDPLPLEMAQMRTKTFKTLDEWENYLDKIHNDRNIVKSTLKKMNNQELLSNPIFIAHETTLQTSSKLLRRFSTSSSKVIYLPVELFTANDPLKIFEARLHFAHLANYLRELEKGAISEKQERPPVVLSVKKEKPSTPTKQARKTFAKKVTESQKLMLDNPFPEEEPKEEPSSHLSKQQKRIKPIPTLQKMEEEEEEQTTEEELPSTPTPDQHEEGDYYPLADFPSTLSSASSSSTAASAVVPTTYKPTKKSLAKKKSPSKPVSRIDLSHLTAKQLRLMVNIFKTPHNVLRVKNLAQLVLDLGGIIKPMGGSVTTMSLPQGAFVFNNIQEEDIPRQSSKSSANIHAKHGKGAKNDRKSLAHGFMVRQFRLLFEKVGITEQDLMLTLSKMEQKNSSKEKAE